MSTILAIIFLIVVAINAGMMAAFFLFVGAALGKLFFGILGLFIFGFIGFAVGLALSEKDY